MQSIYLSLSLQNSNVENLPPHVLRLVYKEVSALAADPPEGIKIYPSEEDITELHTAIEGPGKDRTMVSYQTDHMSPILKLTLVCTLLCLHSQSKKLHDKTLNTVSSAQR